MRSPSDAPFTWHGARRWPAVDGTEGRPASRPYKRTPDVARQRRAAIAPLPTADTPRPHIAITTYLSSLQPLARYQLGASEAQSMTVAELLLLADAEDSARWQFLTMEYTDPIGAEWLRCTIAAGYERIGPDEVTCFAGAQEGLHAAMHALLGPDDHAIVVTPGYQGLEAIPLGLCAASAVPLDPDLGWQLCLDQVAAAIRPDTRMIAINFPHNPTGALIGADTLHGLVALCRRHGVWLLSDEVYRMTEWDPARRLPQAADLYERGISLNVVSKAYGLPGLRVGWIACRDHALVGRMRAVKQFLSTCNAGPSEVLANIALKEGGRILGRNRMVRAANWAALGASLDRRPDLFDVVTPRGGMVAYPRYRGAEGAEAFVRRMAGAAGVILLPASLFRSELAPTPPDRFRIGFGRADFQAGLAALDAALGATLGVA